MKKSLSLLIIVGMLSGFIFADNVTGKITPAGKFEAALETGSRTLAYERDLKNFDEFNVNSVGIKYGINKYWGIALEYTNLISQVRMQSTVLDNTYTFKGPLSLGAEYNTGAYYGLDTKVFAQYDLVGLATTVKSGNNDYTVQSKDTVLGMTASKTGLFDPKLTLGIAYALVNTTLSVDKELENMVVDLPRNAMEIKLGADYLLSETASVYLNIGKRYDSSVLGANDAEVPDPVVKDEYGYIDLGLKVLY